jgi:hypothetical protein
LSVECFALVRELSPALGENLDGLDGLIIGPISDVETTCAWR